MSILEKLEPYRVFYYFEKLCQIPHGSRNTKQISDYLVAFAKEQKLRYIQDESNNVILYKDAFLGYEKAPTVILQGHMDMVCEKRADSSHDFTKDGLSLLIEGDFITAKDTTLGGDDGIAVAYALALLERSDLPHPALEVVITVDEEIGLLGAAALDTSVLKGSYLLNIDSEEEGYLWTGCAGGLTAMMELPVQYREEHNICCEVIIDGLMGGHSGAEIDKNRANANLLMGRFLYEAAEQLTYSLASLTGGTKDNAITRQANAHVLVQKEEISLLQDYAKSYEQALQNEYTNADDAITVTVIEQGEQTVPVLTPLSFGKVLCYLMNIPNGIQKMSAAIPGLVETSSNLGILSLQEDALFASASVRSSISTAKNALSDKLQYLTEFLGGTYTRKGEYPAWEYKKDSPLRDLMTQVYEDIYHKKPSVKVIHAGLECGLFFEKIPNLDCISFGPDMKDIHTTEEMLCISSTKRVWEYLLEVLKRIN